MDKYLQTPIVNGSTTIQGYAYGQGDHIDDATIIGYSGQTDGGAGFGPHLHMALFHNASITAAGGIYGGQSAKPHHMFHASGNGGYYEDLDYRDFSGTLTITS